MKITHLLTLTVLFLIFSSNAFAQQEPITLMLPQSSYISNPNPALADVNRLYITVNFRCRYDVQDNSSIFPQIEQQVEQQVRTAFGNCDINIIDTVVDENSPLGTLAKKRFGSVSGLRWRQGGVPEFRINVDLLNIADANQIVYHLQASFLKRAQLENGPKSNMMSEVWKEEPVMRLVASDDLAKFLIDDVSLQTRAFIGSWSAARAADKQSDVNQIRPPLRKTTDNKNAKPAKQPEAEAKFIASRNSDIFHKASCSSAKRISANNLVNYATRDEAIAAGKKPCERCNP